MTSSVVSVTGAPPWQVTHPSLLCHTPSISSHTPNMPHTHTHTSKMPHTFYQHTHIHTMPHPLHHLSYLPDWDNPTTHTIWRDFEVTYTLQSSPPPPRGRLSNTRGPLCNSTHANYVMTMTGTTSPDAAWNRPTGRLVYKIKLDMTVYDCSCDNHNHNSDKTYILKRTLINASHHLDGTSDVCVYYFIWVTV